MQLQDMFYRAYQLDSACDCACIKPELPFQKTERCPIVIWWQLFKRFYWISVSLSFNSVNSTISVKPEEASVFLLVYEWRHHCIWKMLSFGDKFMMGYAIWNIVFAWKWVSLTYLYLRSILHLVKNTHFFFFFQKDEQLEFKFVAIKDKR